MNKQDLITKIAQDTGITKSNAAAAVESFIEGIAKSLKKGQPITFVGFGYFQDGAAESAHRAKSSDRRLHQDSETARCPLQRRQGPEAVAQLTQTPVRTPVARDFSPASRTRS